MLCFVRIDLDTKTRSPRSCQSFPTARTHSTVRGAMVGVMLAGASMQNQCHPRARAPLLSHPSSGLVEKDAGSGIRQAVGESNDDVGGSDWSNALAAEKGPSGALPRDPATCVLWCAIALGALVRGIPLDHVGVAPRMSSLTP